jgi:hypothetical protein
VKVETLAEAGDEHVERRLKASAGRKRGRGHAIVRVEPHLDVLPLLRRAVVDRQEVAVERERIARQIAARRDRHDEQSGKERPRHDGIIA